MRDSRHADVQLRTGVLVVDVRWTIDPVAYADILRGKIEYRPAPKPSCSCSSIRFIQVAKVEESEGHNYNWSMGEAKRNLIRTASDSALSVKEGYFVDHEAFRCKQGQPCSPYFRDSWANPDESQDGFQRGSETAPASLVDYPFGWGTLAKITLESCARCVDTGAFLGCAAWGAKWPRIGPREILPITVQDSPSATFFEALRRFESFYSKDKLPVSGRK